MFSDSSICSKSRAIATCTLWNRYITMNGGVRRRQRADKYPWTMIYILAIDVFSISAVAPYSYHMQVIQYVGPATEQKNDCTEFGLCDFIYITALIRK